MRGADERRLSLNPLPGIQEMIHIDEDLGLHLVRPSPVVRSAVIMRGRAKVPRIRAWETKL